MAAVLHKARKNVGEPSLAKVNLTSGNVVWSSLDDEKQGLEERKYRPYMRPFSKARFARVSE